MVKGTIDVTGLPATGNTGPMVIKPFRATAFTAPLVEVEGSSYRSGQARYAGRYR